jgi:hypothetical protein
LKAYLRHNRVRPRLLQVPYPDATVADVRRALDVRERTIRFAVRSQRMSATELHRAFQDEFAPPDVGSDAVR